MENKEYKKGYLEGQLDEAETAYHNLAELAKFLTKNGCL